MSQDDDKLELVVRGVSELRPAMVRAWEFSKMLITCCAVVVTIRAERSKRRLEANAKMWAMLTDISRQIQWPVNGQMVYLRPEDWKDILTASLSSLNQQMRMAPTAEGGMVFLGLSTSKMSIKAMYELIEYMTAFGVDREIVWSEPGE